jgi:hypothetical protein
LADKNGQTRGSSPPSQDAGRSRHLCQNGTSVNVTPLEKEGNDRNVDLNDRAVNVNESNVDLNACDTKLNETIADLHDSEADLADIGLNLSGAVVDGHMDAVGGTLEAC